MRNRSIFIAAMMGMNVVVGHAASQDSNDYANLTSKERQQKLQQLISEFEQSLGAKIEAIRSELEHLDRDALPEANWAKEWAGSYFVGDGLGMNISILVAPENGVLYTERGCLGLYDMNFGTIAEVLPDGLRLDLAIDPDLDVRPFFDDRLYFVKWGSHRFLIPECKMMDFVNDYNAGGFTRENMGLSPKLGGKASLIASAEHREGVPQLPEKWAKLLILEPFQIQMISIEPNEPRHVTGDVWRHSYKVMFDKGSGKGIYEGMELNYQEGNAYGTITIEQIDSESCTGTLDFFEGKEPPEQLPEVGYVFKLPAESPSFVFDNEK